MKSPELQLHQKATEKALVSTHQLKRKQMKAIIITIIKIKLSSLKKFHILKIL
jgi:hypothetical protein